jgi:hypothetical protein
LKYSGEDTELLALYKIHKTSEVQNIFWGKQNHKVYKAKQNPQTHTIASVDFSEVQGRPELLTQMSALTLRPGVFIPSIVHTMMAALTL